MSIAVARGGKAVVETRAESMNLGTKLPQCRKALGMETNQAGHTLLDLGQGG